MAEIIFDNYFLNNIVAWAVLLSFLFFSVFKLLNIKNKLFPAIGLSCFSLLLVFLWKKWSGAITVGDLEEALPIIKTQAGFFIIGIALYFFLPERWQKSASPVNKDNASSENSKIKSEVSEYQSTGTYKTLRKFTGLLLLATGFVYGICLLFPLKNTFLTFLLGSVTFIPYAFIYLPCLFWFYKKRNWPVLMFAFVFWIYDMMGKVLLFFLPLFFPILAVIGLECVRFFEILKMEDLKKKKSLKNSLSL